MSAPHRPKYLVIADDLRRLIDQGQYEIGRSIPPHVELAQIYATSKETAAKAVRLLEGESLVRSVRRRGTIVLPHPDRVRRNRVRTVLTDERGYYFDTIATDWVAVDQPEYRWGPAPHDIARLLAIPSGTHVFIRDRAVGSPAEQHAEQIVTSYLPRWIAEGTVLETPDSGPGGIYARMEEDFGLGPLSWIETISSRMPHDHEARVLGASKRLPLLRILRTTWAADGRVVEINDSRMSAQKYELTYPLPRGGQVTFEPHNRERT